MNESGGIAQSIAMLPLFRADWVLYFLMLMSLLSVGVMIERWWFFRQHRVNADALRIDLERALDKGDFEGAATALQRYDSFETNVVLYALRQARLGADSAEELLRGAEAKEKLRYTRRLSVLATIGSNSPFIGLFGTVLGIIRAFRDLAQNTAGVGNSVMFGISEALVATAVGLLVAIPAVVAYNVFTSKLKTVTANADFLSRSLLSVLKKE